LELLKCAVCAEEKPRDAFNKDKNLLSGVRSKCKKCNAAWQRERYAAGHKNDDSRWQSRIKYRYGLTKEGFDALWEESNGQCSICTTQLRIEHSGYAIDHNHATGAVRGLLCTACNSGLGHFRDSANLLEAAVAYLDRKGSYAKQTTCSAEAAS
jgi:hypothetical protein